MKYLLDSNVWIDCMRGKNPNVPNRLQSEDPEEVGLSLVSYYELIFGAYRSSRTAISLQAIHAFLAPYDILELTSDIAEEYGQIRSDLEARGLKIGPFDTLIAAQARFLSLTLVTNNLREFQRVPGLQVETWV